MKGKIKQTKGDPNPTYYIIEGDDGKEYFAHIGDIKENENKLYDLDKKGETVKLTENDQVEFTIASENSTDGHAIHVKKL